MGRAESHRLLLQRFVRGEGATIGTQAGRGQGGEQVFGVIGTGHADGAGRGDAGRLQRFGAG